MKRNLMCCFLILILSKGEVYAHFSTRTKEKLLNGNIKYRLFTVSQRYLGNNKVSPRMNLINVLLPNRIKRKLKRTKREKLIALLEDAKYDWAINLILCDVYKQEAGLYINIIKNREDWLKIKGIGVEQWSQFLDK